MVRVDGGGVGVIGGGRGDTGDHGGGGGAQGLSVQGGHVATLHPVQITTHVYVQQVCGNPQRLFQGVVVFLLNKM